MGRSPEQYPIQGYENRLDHCDGPFKKLAPMHDTPICSERAFRPVSSPTQCSPVKAPPPLPVPPNSADLACMTDEQVVCCVSNGSIKDHELEKRLKDYSR